MKTDAKILVVDDFEMMRFVLTKCLKDLGFSHVEEAVDGKDAMAKLAEASAAKPFEFVFCDWTMPNASGLEVLKYCRSTPQYQKVPFVMVTAEAQAQSVLTAMQAGATDYIAKPVSPENLSVRLKKILTKANLLAA